MKLTLTLLMTPQRGSTLGLDIPLCLALHSHNYNNKIIHRTRTPRGSHVPSARMFFLLSCLPGPLISLNPRPALPPPQNPPVIATRWPLFLPSHIIWLVSLFSTVDDMFVDGNSYCSQRTACGWRRAKRFIGVIST